MKCAIVCDTLVADDGASDECVHCGTVYPWPTQRRPLAARDHTSKGSIFHGATETGMVGGTEGTGQGQSRVLEARRPPIALPRSRGVLAHHSNGYYTPLRPGATYWTPSPKHLARVLRPLYARRARMDRADQEE